MRAILVRSMIPASSRAEQLRLRIRQLLVSAGAPPHRGWISTPRTQRFRLPVNTTPPDRVPPDAMMAWDGERRECFWVPSE